VYKCKIFSWKDTDLTKIPFLASDLVVPVFITMFLYDTLECSRCHQSVGGYTQEVEIDITAK